MADQPNVLNTSREGVLPPGGCAGITPNAARTKVTASHLKREAFLYVRQSTLHQVMQNTESTQRQYALQQRAIALGWPMDRVQVIDCDLGHSGASTVDRAGFQQLVTEVSLGHAGIVLGLDASRLDWRATRRIGSACWNCAPWPIR